MAVTRNNLLKRLENYQKLLENATRNQANPDIIALLNRKINETEEGLKWIVK